jgi:hypothetical protein
VVFSQGQKITSAKRGAGEKMKRLPRLQVSSNKRFIVTENNHPFFWLADTAWELFHRLTREEAKLYFAKRQERRFNLVQAVVLAEFDGLNTPNAYGEKPLIDNDPLRLNEGYFAYVDELLQLAAEHELYVGLLPTWGDKVTPNWGAGPVVFDEMNARAYGKLLAERWQKQGNIVWIIGGDRPARKGETDWTPIWRGVAEGILDVDAKALLTYHPQGGIASTSVYLHQEPWLHINMMQSGHGGGHDVPMWEWIERDYKLSPTKPTLDAEPNYEDHPVNPWPTFDPKNGYFNDYDVRKQMYRSVFAGGCGVTYGHQSVWQFASEKHEYINHAKMDWQTAIDRPGANQVKHLRYLIESYPYLSRIPDQSIIVSEVGRGEAHIRATRDSKGSYALVYLPKPLPVTVRLDVIVGNTIKASWFDTCSGEVTEIATFENKGQMTFTPPGYRPDWVLRLENKI